jgi:hypothetical protein
MRITSSLFSQTQSTYQLRSATGPETGPKVPEDAAATPLKDRPGASATMVDFDDYAGVRERSAELISRSRAGEDSRHGHGGHGDHDDDVAPRRTRPPEQVRIREVSAELLSGSRRGDHGDHDDGASPLRDRPGASGDMIDFDDYAGVRESSAELTSRSHAGEGSRHGHGGHGDHDDDVAPRRTRPPEQVRIREVSAELLSGSRRGDHGDHDDGASPLRDRPGASGDMIDFDDYTGVRETFAEAMDSMRGQRGNGHHDDDHSGRVNHQMRHVAKDMAHDIRDVVKDFAKGIEDHETRHEIKDLGQQFKHDVKDAQRAMHHGELDAEGFFAAMESAFGRLTSSLEGLGAEAGEVEQAPATFQVEIASVDEITVDADSADAVAGEPESTHVEGAPVEQAESAPVEPQAASTDFGGQLRSLVQSLGESFGVQLGELHDLIQGALKSQEVAAVEEPAAGDTAGPTTFQLAITHYTSFSLTVTGDVGSQLDLSS